MSKIKSIFILGFWVAILPYLGFPYFLKNILFSITGLFFVYIGYILYKEQKTLKMIKKKSFDNFSENSNFSDTQKDTEEIDSDILDLNNNK